MGAITNETTDIRFESKYSWPRSGGVLEWIANGISDHGGFMVIGPFTAKITFFNILLGVIPGTATVTHEQRQKRRP